MYITLQLNYYITSYLVVMDWLLSVGPCRVAQQHLGGVFSPALQTTLKYR